MSLPALMHSRRVRETPFEERVLEQGASAMTVYNRMTLPSLFESAQADYEHLRRHVQIWDVACERQVEVVGRDALQLVELATPRDISKCEVGQCVYAPLCDEDGGIVNDPIILRLAEDRFWLSIADSDVLLWMKGLAVGRGLRVRVFEPDVSPLAVQGPKAERLMQTLLGDEIVQLRFFRFLHAELAQTPVVVARTGWSGQGGFEIYLQDSARGLALWDVIWEAGQAHQIRAGCPNLIDRIEVGLLSYGSEMTLENNPFECGLDRFFELGKPAEYLARAALERVAREGVTRRLVNLRIDGAPVTGPRSTWEVRDDAGRQIGIVTSQAWSPKYAASLAFATVSVEHALVGNRVSVVVGDRDSRHATVATRDWAAEPSAT